MDGSRNAGGGGCLVVVIVAFPVLPLLVVWNDQTKCIHGGAGLQSVVQGIEKDVDGMGNMVWMGRGTQVGVVALLW